MAGPGMTVNSSQLRTANRNPLSCEQPIGIRILSCEQPIEIRILSCEQPIGIRILSCEQPIGTQILSCQQPIATLTLALCSYTEHEFVNLLRSPGTDCQPGGIDSLAGQYDNPIWRTGTPACMNSWAP
jgi:hypothetical protein